MSNIIPLFSSDNSLFGSILTTDPPEEIKDNSPVSIFSIAKEFSIDPIFICETSFSGFIPCYKNAEKLKKQLVFGIRFKVVTNAKDQSEESLKTESNVCVFMRNSNGYKDLIKLYSAAHANKDTFYYTGRLDWDALKLLWTDNLLLTIPFYNSFIHKNLLNHNHLAIPMLGDIKPIFHVEEHGLPFDGIIKKGVQDYCGGENCEILESHSVYYHKDKDSKAFQVFKCIGNRSTFQKPQMEFFCQNTFSFESYLRRINE
jgi:DNA polymerase III alpha subunit